MLPEIKAELNKLILDFSFRRNLSLILVMTVAILFGLTELNSQNQDLSGNSGSSLTRIAVKSL